METTAVVGFDVARVDSWLATVVPVAPPITWMRLQGGHSNLTYLLRDAGGREFVIRRPPQGPLLPKAHDMQREYRIISGLWRSAVPVARPIAYVDDRAVAETHFYVMGKSEGRPMFSGAAVDAWLDRAGRARAGGSFIEVLAALHTVDPADVGLADLARHDGYIARQLKTWYGSWTAQAASAGYDDPRIHELHERLAAQIPDQGPARVVHGDYGPHNILFSQAGRIQAVLDWEIATLGDPLADFAYSLNAWAGPGEEGPYGEDPPTALPGFPTRAELVERYAQATGADLSRLPYYRAFNAWKLACILHGVYARYRAGQKSTEGVDLPALFRRMHLAIDAAMEHAASLRP